VGGLRRVEIRLFLVEAGARRGVAWSEVYYVLNVRGRVI
jgi:hypothetical protein